MTKFNFILTYLNKSVTGFFLLPLDLKFRFIVAILLSWTVLGALPTLQLGYFGQVEGKLAFLHAIAAFLSLYMLRNILKKPRNIEVFFEPLVWIPFSIGLFSLFSAIFQRLPILALYGSVQIGQGAFLYFDLAIFTAFFAPIFYSNKLKIYLGLNFIILTLIVTIFTLRPFIGGFTPIVFFGFPDYLCFYALFSIILFSFSTKKEVVPILLLFFAGPYFLLTDNRSALVLWAIIMTVTLFWKTLDKLIQEYNFKVLTFIKTFLKVFINVKFFAVVPIIISAVILLSSLIFWDGVGALDPNIAENSYIASAVVRGMLAHLVVDDFLTLKAMFLGFGWGSVSELIISNFPTEAFNQIRLGTRVHFHTHVEPLEHLICLGIPGLLLYFSYMFFVFKKAFAFSIYHAMPWLLYFTICTFWFQFAGNIPLLALCTSVLLVQQKNKVSDKLGNNFKILSNKTIVILGFSWTSFFLIFGSYVGFMTAINNQSMVPPKTINNATDYSLGSDCLYPVSDFGRGGIHMAVFYNSFFEYLADEIKNKRKLQDSDYLVADWYGCVAEKLISKNESSIELINATVNARSQLSIFQGEESARLVTLLESHMGGWEERLSLLLSLAPKRGDQVTAFVAHTLTKNNYPALLRICTKARLNGRSQAFCDLAEAAVLLSEGEDKRGEAIKLLKRAEKLGVYNNPDIDPELSKKLKEIFKRI